jgi:hypothetical protein
MGSRAPSCIQDTAINATNFRALTKVLRLKLSAATLMVAERRCFTVSLDFTLYFGGENKIKLHTDVIYILSQ